MSGHGAAPPARQAAGAARYLALEPRARVLDLACGCGRQTMELARLGLRVLGVDDREEALGRARAAARDVRLNVHFLNTDVRRISYRDEFDAVVNLHRSVGALPCERDLLKVLDGARRALKPGGKLLLDLLNRERVIRSLPSAAAGRPGLDLETGRLESRRGAAAGLRVYALTEIRALLERCGLAYRRSWGGYEGQDYGLESERLIVLAERSAAEPRRRQRRVEELEAAIRIKGRRK